MRMNRALPVLVAGLMVLASLAGADVLTRHDGQAIKGRVTGFAARKFAFLANDGSVYSGYPLDIKSIVPEAPVKVSLKFALKQYDNAEFVQYDHNTVRIRKNGAVQNEPVITLMTMRLPVTAADKFPDRIVAEGETDDGEPRLEAPEEELKPREWQQTGKWREIAVDQSSVISRGEEVDIEAALKKGSVTVVHFHYPRSLTSVREGNYLEALAAKRKSQIALLKVIVPDFKAPICTALDIRGLPQFWIYNTEGRLVTKLTDRFTEGDIDAAIKNALRAR